MGAGRGLTMALRSASTVKSRTHQIEENRKPKQSPAKSRKRPMREEPQECAKRRRKLAPKQDGNKGPHTVGTNGKLENQFNKLVCEFGDCDPNYIRQLLLEVRKGPQSYTCVRKALLATCKTYPKLREKLRRQHVREQREQLGNRLTLPEYVKRRYLLTGGDRADRTYLSDTVTYLGNTFRFLCTSYIRKIVGTEGLHPDIYNRLKRTDEAVSQDLPTRPARRFVYSAPKRKTLPYSENEFSELFYLDKFYIENQEAVDEYTQQQEDMRTDDNEPQTESFGISETECPVCFLLEPTANMVCCEGGEHLFCRTCISSYLQEQQILDKESFTCLSTACTELLPLSILKELLHESRYRRAELRAREKELRESQVGGVEWCLQCPYGVVFPADCKQTILQCENPDCLVATCRQCRDHAHIPYSCEERAEASRLMKRFIQNSMSEAIIRKCPKCETRFIKDGGCNAVQCPNCRMNICYACGQQRSKCSNKKQCKITSTSIIHRRDILEIIPKAEEVFKKSHPEAEKLSFGAQLLKN